MIKLFDVLMDHLGAREDEMAMEIREELRKYVTRAENDARWLACLEGAGVDNWSGFDYASEAYNMESN